MLLLAGKSSETSQAGGLNTPPALISEQIGKCIRVLHFSTATCFTFQPPHTWMLQLWRKSDEKSKVFEISRCSICLVLVGRTTSFVLDFNISERGIRVLGGCKYARKSRFKSICRHESVTESDDLGGILTSKDKLKRPQEGTGEYKPMFSLPPGTNIQVNIRNVEFQKSNDIKTIDVTPETVE